MRSLDKQLPLDRSFGILCVVVFSVVGYALSNGFSEIMSYGCLAAAIAVGFISLSAPVSLLLRGRLR